MAETIFWWVFIFACVLGFFLSYGMVEDLLCKWVRGRQARKQAPRTIDNSPDPMGMDIQTLFYTENCKVVMIPGFAAAPLWTAYPVRPLILLKSLGFLRCVPVLCPCFTGQFQDWRNQRRSPNQPSRIDVG